MDPLSTVEKAVDILFHLHQAGEPQGVTEIGRSLGLPKSSAHRLLGALGRRGLVERSTRGRYQPGSALIALGLGQLERDPVVELARDVLEDAVGVLGETLFLVTARARELVVIDKVEGTGFLRVSPQVGERVPVHATAVGKLYLAFAPEAVGLPEEPETFTAHTQTARDAVQRSAELAREQGFATNDEEWVPGLGVVAAPVFFRERLIATVALGGAAARLCEIGEKAVLANVREAASRIEARLRADKSEYARQALEAAR
ncbi:MAG: IclR family transcriptional regulator [Myxococcota bacterium]|nr:IclR family transcriptional regulator [Myxococcota bacterium]